MKIANFVRIIDGKLATTPPIDAFASIALESTRVFHGDLFIDTTASREQIHHALSKGAYAILTTLPFEKEDEECAWIEINSIDHTLIKLLRYTITQKSLTITALSPVQEALLEMIQTPRVLKRLKNDLLSITKTLLSAKEEEHFFLSDTALVRQIAPAAHWVPTSLHVKPVVMPKGLFLSSFSYNERFFFEQKIPSLFVEELLSLLSFCEISNIAYTLEHLSFSEHFYPQFVTQTLCKKEFGSSARALIFEPSSALMPTLIAYVQTHVEASQLLLCLPRSLQDTFAFEGETLFFERIEELSILSEKSFLYALILSDKETCEPLFNKAFMPQPSLF